MSNTDASGTAGPPVIIPLPRASAAADPIGNGANSNNISISDSNVARLLSIQRKLLHLTSDRPEAARLLEEMGRIVSPLVAQPDDTTTPNASDTISQVLGNPDILVHGLLFFSKAGLATILRVTKRWKSVLDSVEDKLWTGIAHREVPLIFSAIKGKSGRQWRDFLKRRCVMDVMKWRFIVDRPPTIIRQPESSLPNLDKYVFELEFKVVVVVNERPGPNVEWFHYVPLRFLLSASPRPGGGIILHNDNAEDARRLKTVANTALAKSSDDEINACEWVLRVTHKETLQRAFLFNKFTRCILQYDKETCKGVMQELWGESLIYISKEEEDGFRHIIAEDRSRTLPNDYGYNLHPSIDSFLVSNERVTFLMTFPLAVGEYGRHEHDCHDLAFLFANLHWGY